MLLTTQQIHCCMSETIDQMSLALMSRSAPIIHMHTLKCANRVSKEVVDRGFAVGVISILAITRMKLEPELHPRSCVLWADSASLLVFQRCFGSYAESRLF